MRTSLTLAISLTVAALAACDAEEGTLQGWDDDDVDVIEEGLAAGEADVIVSGSDVVEPMRGTGTDTTDAIDLLEEDGLALEREGEPQDGTLASQLYPEGEESESGDPTEAFRRTYEQDRASQRERPSPSPPVQATRPSPRDAESQGTPERTTETRESRPPARSVPAPGSAAPEPQDEPRPVTTPASADSEQPEEPEPQPDAGESEEPQEDPEDPNRSPMA